VGAGAQYVGERLNGNTTTARVAPDYWLFDAMLAYEVNEHLTLRLNAYNLADREYIDRVGGGHFIPGAGRSAILTAQFNF
jgi:catecholate siderophore receptor